MKCNSWLLVAVRQSRGVSARSRAAMARPGSPWLPAIAPHGLAMALLTILAIAVQGTRASIVFCGEKEKEKEKENLLPRPEIP